MERREHVCSRSSVVKCVIHALLMHYSHAGSRWWSLAIKSRIMWCAFFSRQSRYSNVTHSLMNVRQSFWSMNVHQSPAFSIFLNIFPCVTRSLTLIAKPRGDRPLQSHIVHARPTHWKLIFFCQSMCRATVVLQHSLFERAALMLRIFLCAL